jgi:hypothetical protein
MECERPNCEKRLKPKRMQGTPRGKVCSDDCKEKIMRMPAVGCPNGCYFKLLKDPTDGYPRICTECGAHIESRTAPATPDEMKSDKV